MNPLITKYTPFVIKYVVNKAGMPKTEDELIELCQILVGQIIAKIEPIHKN